MHGGFADIHSHILPGVDDGAADKSQAIFALKQMEKLGVTDLIFTPHYCKRRGYEMPLGEIAGVYDSFTDACRREGININFYLGTEMEYSTDAIRYIKEGRVNTLASSDYILVEFPPYVKASTILKASKEILQLGLIPVIAHIERYDSLRRDFKTVYALKEVGAKLQINIRAVCLKSFKIRRFIKRIISGRLADFLAGDVHACPIEEKEYTKCCKFIIKHSSEQYLTQLLCENAKNIINRR